MFILCMSESCVEMGCIILSIVSLYSKHCISELLLRAGVKFTEFRDSDFQML